MMRRALTTAAGRRFAAPAMPPRPATTTTPEELVAELAARPSTSLLNFTPSRFPHAPPPRHVSESMPWMNVYDGGELGGSY